MKQKAALEANRKQIESVRRAQVAQIQTQLHIKTLYDCGPCNSNKPIGTLPTGGVNLQGMANGLGFEC
jgi:hypothetical protein